MGQTTPHKHKIPVLTLAILAIAGLASSSFWLFNKHTQTHATEANHEDKKTAVKPEDFTSVQNVPQGVFNYGGSTSWAPIRQVADSQIQAAHPDFKLNYVLPTVNKTSGSDGGIKMLIDGKINFAQSSRPISESEYKQAQQHGFKLEQIGVAIDMVAVAVNPNLNISGLTIDQLKSIYTGKITNWKKLGGPNLAIKPLSRPLHNNGTVELFEKEILENRPFSSTVHIVTTTTEGLQRLSEPGAIYFASAAEIVPQCGIKPLALARSGKLVTPYQEPFIPPSQCPERRNQINVAAAEKDEYPITRLLYVIVKQNNQIDQQAGTAYANLILSKQGQGMVSQAGFIKMRQAN
jgi:phosphate transport system substrate-binding protein